MGKAERPAWFDIPGVQQGVRTLEEQMKGLAPALAEAKGKTVWDLGSAEGLIALEFMRAGAVVEACDYNGTLVETALNLRGRLAEDERRRVTFRVADLRHVLAEGLTASYDIVLALAVVHKLPKPEESLGYIARATRSLLVIRLPGGSKGTFNTKNYGTQCDVNATLPRHGFALERTEQGPRDELVQYWRRR